MASGIVPQYLGSPAQAEECCKAVPAGGGGGWINHLNTNILKIHTTYSRLVKTLPVDEMSPSFEVIVFRRRIASCETSGKIVLVPPALRWPQIWLLVKNSYIFCYHKSHSWRCCVSKFYSKFFVSRAVNVHTGDRYFVQAYYSSHSLFKSR